MPNRAPAGLALMVDTCASCAQVVGGTTVHHVHGCSIPARSTRIVVLNLVVHDTSTYVPSRFRRNTAVDSTALYMY
jgi:hypothetical protein